MRIKYLTLGLFSLLSAYTAFSFQTNALAVSKTLCQNPIFGALATWDSGCFYRAIYRERNTVGQIDYEKYKLDTFIKKGGRAHTILWYRAQFHQRFKQHLNVSFDDIETMHNEYTVADPAMVDAQVSFWKYLVVHNETVRAQKSLDSYCDAYIRQPKAYLIPALKEVFAEKQINLSLAHCEAQING